MTYRHGPHTRPLRTRLTRGILAAVLAIGLIPTAAFAAGETSNESAIDAFVATLAERFETALETGDASVLHDESDAYRYEEGDGATALAYLPSSYDLRDEGVVTPVKLQNPWASCWGFASIAASETSILSELGATYEEMGIDLSELHLAWFAFTALAENSETYPSQAGEGYYSLNGQSDTLNYGSSLTATSVISSGIGLVPESVAPYHGIDPETGEPTIVYSESGMPLYYSDADDWSLDESLRFYQSFELEEGNLLPSPASTDSSGAYAYDENGTTAIKNEVISGRAVSIAYHYGDGSYLNTETWAHYTPVQVNADHAVTIVGWDDDYPKENFSEGNQPPADGAWIVKNSWGASTEEFPNYSTFGVDGSGYFYLSYYDQSLFLPESFDYYVDEESSLSPYYLLDQYDFLPAQSGPYAGSTENETRMANVFTAGDEGQVLRAVSCETSTPNTSVVYEVFLLGDDAQDPTDGELVATERETYAYGGYHRADLSEPVALEPGARFSVVVTERTPSGLYTLLFDWDMTEDGVEALGEIGISQSHYAVAVVNEGESYLYVEGDWSDWAVVAQETSSELAELLEQTYAQSGIAIDFPDSSLGIDNFPIKAYSDPLPVEFPDVGEGDWFYDAVQYVALAGIMTGFDEYAGELAGMFGPGMAMSREDVAVALYRALDPDGYAETSDPAAYGAAADETGLADAPDGQYYTPALNWAFANGLMTGYEGADGEPAGLFGVGDPMAREQLAAVLYRALGDASGADPSALAAFGDAGEVSAFAEEAMAWCVVRDVVRGEDGLLQPQRAATRAEVAAMMMRLGELQIYS